MSKRGYGSSWKDERNNYDDYEDPEPEDKEQTTLDDWDKKKKK